MLECMPKLVSATDRCGSIAAAAAANTGLAEGTPVYAGLFDIDACALATGVLSDDIFSITAGTWNINVFPSKTMAPLDGGCMNSVFPPVAPWSRRPARPPPATSTTCCA